MARRAWVAFGMAILLWFIGSAAWSIAYSGQPDAPYPSFADVFWMAWYPLVAVGIFYLIRVRIPQFELHRWMDGIAVTLLVLAAGFALVVQPVADHQKVGLLATFVVFAYPVLDVLLIGAVLGSTAFLAGGPTRCGSCSAWLSSACPLRTPSLRCRRPRAEPSCPETATTSSGRRAWS